MASVNQVTLIGYLADDPKSVQTKNNSAMCSFSMGTTEKGYTTQQGVQYPDRTEWHSVSCFGKLADTCLKFLHKGSQVYIQGKLRTRKYTDKNNVDRYVTEIEAETMQMLDRAPSQQQGVQQAQQMQQNYPQQAPNYQQGYAPAPYGQAAAPQMQAGGYYQQQGQAPVFPAQQGQGDVPF